MSGRHALHCEFHPTDRILNMTTLIGHMAKTQTVSTAEAKAKLSEYVAAAESGTETIITRHGRPVARIGGAVVMGRDRLPLTTATSKGHRWSGPCRAHPALLRRCPSPDSLSTVGEGTVEGPGGGPCWRRGLGRQGIGSAADPLHPAGKRRHQRFRAAPNRRV